MGSDASTDIAILGGGLAGGLIALALRRARPEIRTLLMDAGESLGGNHIWSFFGSDVDSEGMALIEPMISHRWPGYEVRFPTHQRSFSNPYHAIRSDRFAEILGDALPEDSVRLRTKVIGASPDAAVLESGERIEAGAVIDCRGAGDLTELVCGWQKFVGIECALAAPHGLEQPIVMDATVEQQDGYRFIYVLPLAEKRIFIEDTYYSDLPAMDAGALEKRCRAYAEAQDWQVEEIVHREKGVLPVAQLGGRFGAYWRSGGKAAKAGMRAGLFHPTTGYSLPEAVRTALKIAKARDYSAEALGGMLFAHAAQCWRAGRFYRMLDTMLFQGTDTSDRYKVLERFYTLNEAVVARFYAGRSTFADKMRLVTGKPPIPITRGLGAIFKGSFA